MTNTQLESHTDQMNAHRRDFMAYWNDTLYPALLDSDYSHKEAMAAQRGAWDSWLRDAASNLSPVTPRKGGGK